MTGWHLTVNRWIDRWKVDSWQSKCCRGDQLVKGWCCEPCQCLAAIKDWYFQLLRLACHHHRPRWPTGTLSNNQTWTKLLKTICAKHSTPSLMCKRMARHSVSKKAETRHGLDGSTSRQERCGAILISWRQPHHRPPCPPSPALLHVFNFSLIDLSVSQFKIFYQLLQFSKFSRHP